MAIDNHTPRTIEIQLTKGYVAIVDEQDADLALLKWSACQPRNTVYARRNTYINRHRGCVYLHQLVLERVLGRKLIKGEVVDHINHNGTDNRRSNLRLADNTKNLQNSRIRSTNETGYKGVSPARHGYTARIKIDKKQIPLGRFQTPVEAACAYNAAAIKYFGEFANLNNIPNWQEVLEKSQPITRNNRNTSGYKGVSKKRDKWRARIMISGEVVELQGFETAEEARDALAEYIKRWG